LKRVDVGGYKLAIECRGTGTPSVMLDSGFGTGRGAWWKVLPLARRTTRVCSYDRAGLGQSDSRPARLPPTTGTIVDELHTLLPRAGLSPPYVLGGWSMGGFDIRYYQARYPTEVAGLVLVDATPPEFLLHVFPSLLLTSEFETMDVGAAASALEPPPSLGTLPLVDLTHGDSGLPPSEEALWIAEQKKVTRSSVNSLLIRADFDDHGIPDESPSLVAEALRLAVVSARTSAHLPQCEEKIRVLSGSCLDPSTR
jgi:pimeloyl-ACP methyl ester carboxylesterase